MHLYFDNAATSFPKPPGVLAAMTHFATEIGASPGRGGYARARAADDVLAGARRRIIALLGADAPPEHVVFTLNASDALNLAIKGVVRHHRRRGTPVHLVTTWMDHNSVLRPFHELARDGVAVTYVEADPRTGLVDPDDVRRAIRPATRLVATLHGSNVTGTLQPIGAIGAVCREAAVPLLVDAAQTLGHVPLDVERDAIDLLAFPGHKGLLGPLGTGGLYLRPGMERLVETIREGGTGSVSEQDVQPEFLPDRYEPGSPNAIGIAGLEAGVAWILARGVDALWEHERRLVATFLEAIEGADGLRLHGPPGVRDRTGVFSLSVDGLDPNAFAARLERDHGVLSRPGLHCAPRAHRTIGTHDAGGTTRLSLGPFLEEDDVRTAAAAVVSVAEQARRDAKAVTA